MDLKDIGQMKNGVRMPMPGENIAMVCKKCGWRGNAKKPGFGIDFENGKMGNFPIPKCPNCGKRSLIQDPMVMY